MNKPLKVGITGGIGSGKSIVSKIFHTLSIPVYNSDDRGKYLTQTSPNIKKQIKEQFGEAYFDEKDVLIAQKLGAVVFTDKDKLKVLNDIVHPEVKKDFEAWLELQQSPYILKESAIIFENGIEKSLDLVITVVCPLSIRIHHIQQRDPFRSKENIEAIISKQMDDEEKIKRSDFVIYNDEQQPLLKQVLNIHDNIIKLYNGRF